MKQSRALGILQSGRSAFLTGEPGAGKTYVINEFLKRTERRVAITASTGIAATHIGGRTIHSWSGIGIRESLTRSDLVDIVNSRAGDRILWAETLIIDEISMISGDTLQMIDFVCRSVRHVNAKPFGGLQVIFVGDFFQLPPVKYQKWHFAFDAPVWEELDPQLCYLTEQHRQSEIDFSWLLLAIRIGLVDPRDPTLIARCVHDRPPENVTTLFTHNRNVDALNLSRLNALPGPGSAFKMTSAGPDRLVAELKRGCQSPETLELRRDALVMFTQNDPAGRFVNGTLGKVIDAALPMVELRDGAIISAEPLVWGILARGDEKPLDTEQAAPFVRKDEYDGEDEYARRKRSQPSYAAAVSQIPLRLGWAMTVHKSQGMSMDAAVMDLSRAFEPGQGYVALSRVRKLEGLHLLGWNDKALTVHPRVMEQNRKFLAQPDSVAAA